MRRWGRFVHRRRWIVLALSGLALVASVIGAATGAQLRNASDYDVEAVHGFQLESDQLPSTIGSSFLLLFTNPSLTVSDTRYQAALQRSLAGLRRDSRVTQIQTPYDGTVTAARLVSSDRHSVAVIVGLKVDFATARGFRNDSRRGHRQWVRHRHGR